MAPKKKRKPTKKPTREEYYKRGGVWHDEHGYYRRDDEKPLPDKWQENVSALVDHRREFLLRIVSRSMHSGSHLSGAATTFMVSDFVQVMAENERLRKELKKAKIKLRKVQQ